MPPAETDSHWISLIREFHYQLLAAAMLRVFSRTPDPAGHQELKLYRGLTYEYMERYIATHNVDMMKVFDELRLISECHSVRYPTIKNWFLETFPEVAQFGVAEVEETKVENELSIVKGVPAAA